MQFAEPLEQLAVPATHFTKGRNFPPPGEIRVYDTTLRDGEQTPGVIFSPEQKYEIAKLLSDMGVHILDLGFPAAAASDRLALQMIVQGKRKGDLRKDIELLVMCRSNKKDIDITTETLKQIGIEPKEVTYFIFTSGSDLHVKYKLGKTLLKREGKPESEWLTTPVSWYRDANVKMMCEAISYAREMGAAEVEFGGEDGSRGDVEYFNRLHLEGLKAGGTRPSWPDTVGFLTPEACDYYIPKLLSALPPKTPFVVHFHNDYGLAAVNTVRAMSHGVRVPTCTANGLGERAGNAPLHQVMVTLRDLYGVTVPGFRYEKLRQLRQLVERYSGVPVGASEPIIGEGVFAHESGIHVAGMLVDPAIYQVIDPQSVGAEIRYVLGKHTGDALVAHVLEAKKEYFAQFGITVDGTFVKRMTSVVKELMERRKAIHGSEVSDAVQAYYRAYAQLGMTERELVELAVAVGRAVPA